MGTSPTGKKEELKKKEESSKKKELEEAKEMNKKMKDSSHGNSEPGN